MYLEKYFCTYNCTPEILATTENSSCTVLQMEMYKRLLVFFKPLTLKVMNKCYSCFSGLKTELVSFPHLLPDAL